MKKYDAVVSTKITSEELQVLQDYANKERTSVSAVTRKAIDKFIRSL